LVVIEFKKLPAESQLAAQFFKSRIDLPLSLSGSRVLVEGGRPKDLKLLLHKFLHRRGLDGYRVVHQSGGLAVLPPEKRRVSHHKEEERPRMEGLSPYSPYRMNPMTTVEFPNYPPVQPRKFKKPKT
jgi:hypothetical protein